MDKNICPNINSCRMISTAEVVPNEKVKDEYIHTWCKNDQEKWSGCKRFITKAELGFCPDFVVPDTALSIDEIVDKFEEES
ncbi:MAG: hypothetical protein DRJ15_07035 [Bacteroidetes bacterium]|nr:MAG: hypothetical protein DRJ15_07035 [Bacteroidota bacterium]